MRRSGDREIVAALLETELLITLLEVDVVGATA